MDWCKLIQSIESTLDIRDSLMVLKTRAEALTAVGSGVAEMDGHHSQAFLARLVGNEVDLRKPYLVNESASRASYQPPLLLK